ncbi:MAG: hypothetical protein BWX68_01416 [Verrucomicrobia bacterium ADurb.Bin063]|nr:MAG: hypothetical protein BWX68_01416 [Verrucomicrobia bacterium ADurb.Bin063]
MRLGGRVNNLFQPGAAIVIRLANKLTLNLRHNDQPPKLPQELTNILCLHCLEPHGESAKKLERLL